MKKSKKESVDPLKAEDLFNSAYEVLQSNRFIVRIPGIPAWLCNSFGPMTKESIKYKNIRFRFYECNSFSLESILPIIEDGHIPITITIDLLGPVGEKYIIHTYSNCILKDFYYPKFDWSDGSKRTFELEYNYNSIKVENDYVNIIKK